MSMIAITCTTLCDGMPPGLLFEAPPPAFTPTSISGLLVWYDADDASTITESGGAVSQWDDKSGNDNHLEQASAGAQFTYTASGINSKGTMQLGTTTTSGKFMVSANNTGLSGNFTATAFAVFTSKTASIMSDYPAVFSQNPGTTNTNYGMLINGNRPGISTWANGANVASGEAIDTTNAHVVCMSKAAGTLTAGTSVYIDGGNALSVAITLGSDSVPNLTNNKLIVGALDQFGIYNLPGDLAELAIYDSVLGTSDRAAMTNYLIDKWGIS